ncbi:AAA family ATPase [Paenibacillus sp. FSL R5-0876]|uniref:ATP-dependent nuclease n=1 Tax=Paenibacillus sp. FSL R5-0876 TaxID=2921661 RepID=UPI0030F8F3A4
MYLSEIRLWNFRKYGAGDIDPTTGKQKPGLYLKLNPGLNLIVGENDAGKTTIIDAIKFVLTTQSNDYFKIDYEDFHVPIGLNDEQKRSDYLEIQCIFRGMKPHEAKNFLEWLSIETHEGTVENYLKVFLKARRKGRRVFFDVKAGGDEEGAQMSSTARALLKATYLKPLRDAENELTPRKNSRLSQILDNHQAFEDKDQHYLTQAMKQANTLIEQYFKGTDGINDFEDQNGKLLLEKINTFLKEFSPKTSPLSSNFTVSGTRLKSILEKLSLQLSSDKFGLGSHNLLFIAVELLLLNQDDFTGLKIALIEEIEAHIHPQAQLRLIDFLQKEAKALGIQLLLTTHSTVLASKVSLDNLILCSNGFCFPMDHKSTKLEKGDYSFLERFLDSTKANLFFAKGVILVEGDAENLLIPMIAEIIERPLSSYGATIVNVGSTAFLRYSRIFLRQDEVLGRMNIPVAVITDSDIRPDLYKSVHPDAQTASDFVGQDLKRKKVERFTEQTVKAFVSPFWTLEYDIAAGSLTKELYKAVLYAKKIEGSETYGLTEVKQKACDDVVDTNLTLWKTQCTQEEIAFKIYHDILLADSVSKAIVAQCLAKILQDAQDKKELKERIMKDPNLKYLINAITYATGGAIND